MFVIFRNSVTPAFVFKTFARPEMKLASFASRVAVKMMRIA
jgi:hypothetical protein